MSLRVSMDEYYFKGSPSKVFIFRFQKKKKSLLIMILMIFTDLNGNDSKLTEKMRMDPCAHLLSDKEKQVTGFISILINGRAWDI